MIDRVALEVHRSAIVVDGIAGELKDPDTAQPWRDGGVTLALPHAANLEDSGAAIARLLQWRAWLDESAGSLLLVRRVEDIDRAKAQNILGIAFHFQNTLPIGRDIGLI
ncbi:MAG: membrane dipeptidase, partial [Actinomycetota bacterium]|nr:membrane dipeptidase [Actinomycetota bacterium]